MSNPDCENDRMKITRERIVRTALRLLNEVGLEGLTLRRIATELDVRAPALYWHVKNKEQLLDELATTLLDDAATEINKAPVHADWREELRVYAEFLRGVMLAHRDGAKVLSGTFYNGDIAAFAPEERLLPLLRSAEFTTEDAVDLIMTILHYTVGYVIEEQEVFPTPGERDPRYDVDTLLATQSARDPDVVRYMFSSDTMQRRFHSGLRLIIAGAESRKAQPDS